MTKDGLTLDESEIIRPVKEKKTARSTTNNQLLQHEEDSSHQQIIEPTEELDLIVESKDFDSDSGVSSIRRSRDKVATSISATNVTTDDELDDEEHLASTKSSVNTGAHDPSRRSSDSSCITNFTINKTTNDYQLSSKTSSRASGLNLPPTISPTSAKSRKPPSARPVNTNVTETKEKHGVRKFIQKLLRSSSSSSSSSVTPRNQSIPRSPVLDPPKSPGLNIDLVHGTAYPSISPLPVTQGPIRLLVLRHGERLDRYYSSQWLRQAFDKDGNFCRFSPILPETLPFRASIRDFDLDPPLTYKGLKDAYHTGTVLKDKSICINYCYSSPALRCVQTAAKIIEGLQLQNKIKIRIEPGLFECTGWYTAGETSNTLTMPRFMTKKELLENKYVIDKNYHEQMSNADISKLETELEFYQRSHTVTSNILKIHENEYITQLQQGQTTSQHPMHILFIAHAPSLETCTRKLCGGKFRPDTLPHVIRNVDFLTMTVIEKTDNNCDKWIFRRSSFYGDEF